MFSVGIKTVRSLPIIVPWNQNNNDRSGILNRFIGQENLQNYAQMHRILLCHWNNTHSIVLTNGKIHLVMFNCLVLVYHVILQLQSDWIPILNINTMSPHHCVMQRMTQYSFFMYHYINIKLIFWIYLTKLQYCIAKQIGYE